VLIREAELFAVATAVSMSLTYLLIRYAKVFAPIDIPNERSSHRTPTPRGGGLAIAVVAWVGTLFSNGPKLLDPRVLVALLVGGFLVAGVGYADDKLQLRAGIRFLVHLVAASLMVGMVAAAGNLHWFVVLLFVVGIAWSINLFNFMDGIDGIAGSQAVFVAGATAVLVTEGAQSSTTELWVLTCGAALGFLVWNWSPSKIFMGDVGSGFLGYWIAALSLVLHTEGALSIWTSIVLNGVFISDATATLVRRFLLGKRWYEAHRSHAYQHLAVRWGSHRRVTLVVWGVNLFLVVPLSVATKVCGSFAPGIAVGTIALLSLIAWRCGAGVDELRQSESVSCKQGIG
jgi:Fuc2NAc and GlcNAc transferase